VRIPLREDFIAASIYEYGLWDDAGGFEEDDGGADHG
jgi:hypothetical protein